MIYLFQKLLRTSVDIFPKVAANEHMLHEMITIWFSWIRDWGYAGVFFLMALESTVVPVPSELVLPPAAFWAAQGQMNFWGVVAAGTLGSYLGSLVSYLAFRWLGKPLIQLAQKYHLLKAEKEAVVEDLIAAHGAIGVFFARFLPVIRHLISIPAGLFKLNFRSFSVASVAGSFFWCLILSYWGEKVIGSHPELLNSPEEMMHAVRSEMSWFVVGVVVFILLYSLVVWMKNRSKEKHSVSGHMPG